MSRSRSDIRERALGAAVDLAAERGVSAVTFDAVAEHIGASKGAVLHHFRTKDAILAAVVERISVEYQEGITSAMAADPNPIGAFSRAVVRFEPSEWMDRAVRGMLAVVLERPDLVEPLAGFVHWCHERVRNDGIDPVVASIVTAAADGVWLSGVIGTPSIPPEFGVASRDWLLALIDREAEAAASRRPVPRRDAEAKEKAKGARRR